MDRFEVLVPIKPLGLAKQRLGVRLSAAARADLACEVLATVLCAAAGAAQVEAAFVVTSDPRAAQLAAAHGAQVVDDPGRGLNEALDAAAETRRRAGARALAVLQGDLAWLTAAALDAFLVQVATPSAAAVAPDQHRLGTSALAWREPLAPVRFAFGDDSFAAHERLFDAVAPRLARLAPDPAFRDLDDLHDLAAYRPLVAGGVPA